MEITPLISAGSPPPAPPPGQPSASATPQPPAGYEAQLEKMRRDYDDLISGATATPETAAAQVDAHAGHPASSDDLITWNALDNRVRLSGNLFGEIGGKGYYNQPLIYNGEVSQPDIYQGYVALLSEFRIESDYQIEALKGVPFLENILGGKTRLDHVGVHAVVQTEGKSPDLEFVGTLTHTWADLPLTSGEGDFKPALSVSFYSTGHRHPEDRDIFMGPAHGAMGGIVYEKATGLFTQFGGEHLQNQPWEQSLLIRGGWMMPLDQVYESLGLNDVKDVLGGGPHSHGDTHTALPNSADTVWERSKIAAYYQYKSYSDPQQAVFNGADVTGGEHTLGLYLEHRFGDEFQNGMLKALFADARLLTGVEFKQLDLSGSTANVANDTSPWIAPALVYDKAIHVAPYTTLHLKLFAEGTQIASENNAGDVTLKRAMTYGFEIGTSLSAKAFTRSPTML